MMRRVIVDECLPRKLAALLNGEVVTTVPKHGWASRKNGELLALAAQEFDVFVTHDQKLEHEQDLQKFDIGVVVIHAKSNRLADIRPLVAEINAAIDVVRSHCVVRVGT
jgi:predicted nuclease of predicted toxin-antitoxin system